MQPMAEWRPPCRDKEEQQGPFLLIRTEATGEYKKRTTPLYISSSFLLDSKFYQLYIPLLFPTQQD